MTSENENCGPERRACEFPALRIAWINNFAMIDKNFAAIDKKFDDLNKKIDDQNKKIDMILEKFQRDQVDKAKNSWVIHVVRYAVTAIAGALAAHYITTKIGGK